MRHKKRWGVFMEGKNEQVVGPMPFEHACRYLSNLITQSRAFIGGSKPYIGRLKTSYGYKKVIGIISFDHQVRTRIDYDPFKGYHFNFENFTTGEKICIRINDMSKEQFERYIDTLTKGRGPIETPKMPNFQYQLLDRESAKISKEEYSIINKITNELDRSKFVMDYYDELLLLGDNFEIELSYNEIKSIDRRRKNMNDKILKDISLLVYYSYKIGIDLDLAELYDTYLNENSLGDNYNRFRK